MSRCLRASACLLVAVLSAACAPVPPPNVLSELDGVRGSAAAAEARRFAPDAFAHAEKLGHEADEAFKARDLAGAEILGEHAVAAYAHALAIARRARADAQAGEAKVALARAEAELSTLDGDQARAAAEADALETKLRVARDAVPVTPSGRADPERERARMAAARALATQARLLCGAARLLGGSPATPPIAQADLHTVDEAEAGLARVDADLAAGPAAPIDGATRARAACLRSLTLLRRARTSASRASGAGDALLAELAAAGKLDPSRDDRGVTVTLRGIFAGGAALSPASAARLGELGRVAAAHASFPVELVLHTDRPVAPRDEPAEKAKVEAALGALLKTAGDKVRALALVAGDRTPIADPHGPDRARNARLEVVFVTPESF